MRNYKNYTIDYFSILLFPKSHELHKHVNAEEKFWYTYKIYIYFLHIYQIEISKVGLHCLLLRKIRWVRAFKNVLTVAEFLIHRRSGMGFPANRAQGRVSCCPSITLVTEGLIPMRGATESERAQALRTLCHPREDKLSHRPICLLSQIS